MEYLHRTVRVVPLREAVQALAGDNIHHPTVALTFDDGYQNNCDIALPILRDFSLPATVFLVTDLIGSNDTVWFCRLNQAVAATRQQSFSWRGDKFALGTRYERANTSALLQSRLKQLSHDDMLVCVGEILSQLRVDPKQPIERTSPYRMLDARAIKTMTESGLIDFGAHTASHTILAREWNRERVRGEIINSIREIEQLTGAPCRTFAYPNGGPNDFGPEDSRLLEQLGIDVAVTTIAGPNMRNTPTLALRRYGVGMDCTSSGFRCLVHHFDARHIMRIVRGTWDASPG